MRRALLTLAASLVLLGGAGAQRAAAGGPAERSLNRALNSGMRAAGSSSGAYVVDLTTGQPLYSNHARARRLPASVEKLFTTSTALECFGPNGTLTTSILGVGKQRGTTFTGTLYLRGGGDPTFGSASFDQASYGTGATVQRLVTDLIAGTKIRSLAGNVVADESTFDALRGTPATGYRPSVDVEGELSAVSFNRGWASGDGSSYFYRPALEAGAQLVSALQAAGVKLSRRTSVSTGRTPPGAELLTQIHSPRIATLISLTNTPSDNFFAEMLLKGLGARYGAAGTTAAGAAVVRAQVARRWRIHPRLDDGSGLSRFDRTTPIDVVSLLRQLAGNSTFTGSLAIAGQTGTLEYEMRGTYAQGRCRGKTGTLPDVSNVAGYCRATDGHTLAYAFLMNGIDAYYAHPIQDQMQVALARYDG